MTQKQYYSVIALQKEAYKQYLTLCNAINEIPRMDVVTLIDGCTDTHKLDETIKIFQKKYS